MHPHSALHTAAFAFMLVAVIAISVVLMVRICRGDMAFVRQRLLIYIGMICPQIEAQTNMPLMLTLLYDCAQNISDSALLFQDAFTTDLVCPKGMLRKTIPEETASIFAHHCEPVGEWLIEANGEVVATAGALYHYNPPYGDIHMEVSEPARSQGFGSYLVQEVKRICYESGKKPAARCNPANIGSRRTLQKAGFLPCGRLLVGEIVGITGE